MKNLTSVFFYVTLILLSTISSKSKNAEIPQILREPEDIVIPIDLQNLEDYGDWYKYQRGLYRVINEYKDSTGYNMNEFYRRLEPGTLSSYPYVFNQSITKMIRYTVDTIKWNAASDTIYNHNFSYVKGDTILNGFIISTGCDTRYATGPGFSDMRKGWPEYFPEEEKIIFDRMKTSISRTILNDMRKPVQDIKYPECIYNYFSRIIIRDGKVEDIQTLSSRDLKYQNIKKIWGEE